MFHSVGLEKYPWTWSYISESVDIFEKKISSFKKLGFNSVFWQDVYDHMSGRKSLPDNSILLTFDDGYLDNWVNVFPILKKYDMKGTIFVSPDFVDPSEQLRPTLDDLRGGHIPEQDLTTAGFLSWAEMREMEKSGVVDIQSHAMTHTWYFSSPSILSYHRPHAITPYPWLFWNARPDRKPFYLTENQQDFLPWGLPILEHEKSLVARRFIPEENVVNSIIDFVTDSGGVGFFQAGDWHSQLNRFVHNACGSGEMPGSYESDEARQKRITSEIVDSKKLIERELEKEVKFICWPGGANSEETQKIASKAGYVSWTLSSRDKADVRNRPGVGPSEIKRIGTSNALQIRGRNCGSGGPTYQNLRILAHRESVWHSFVLKCYKLVAFALSWVRAA